MTITRMLTNGAKHGMVLQGFFGRERFLAQAAAAVQPKAPDFWAGKAPRPELMPTKMHQVAVQPKAISASPGASVWLGAPRPELLPGMGRSRLAAQPAAAQRRSTEGVTTSQVPDGMLRLAGNGKPLDDGIRAKMESFFNADFSGVRVHEGPAAQAMGALAFTLGETLYFAPGLYDPTTREGVELLGHELTHVVQQRAGQVTNPYDRGVAIVQDPRLEAEADKMGQKIASQLWSGTPSMITKKTPNSLARVTLSDSISSLARTRSIKSTQNLSASVLQPTLDTKVKDGVYQITGRPEFTTKLKQQVIRNADKDGETYITSYSADGKTFKFPTIHRRHKLAWVLWRDVVNKILRGGTKEDLEIFLKECFVSEKYKKWTDTQFKNAWKEGLRLKDMARDFFNNPNNVWLGEGEENTSEGAKLKSLLSAYKKGPTSLRKEKLINAAHDPRSQKDLRIELDSKKRATLKSKRISTPNQSPNSKQMGKAVRLGADILGVKSP